MMRYVLMLLFSVVACQAQRLQIDHAHEIVFGQSAMFSGSMGVYAHSIKDAINAYFSRVNKEGGVRGKHLRLVSLDDKADLKVAKKNMDLFLKQGVTMFLGNMGSKNTTHLLPILEQDSIGLLFPWTGDMRLRNASLKSVINGPGLMAQQVTKLAEYTVKHLGHKRVAIFHADDSFSTKTARALQEACAALNAEPLAVVSYNRFTLDIKTKSRDLLEVDPRAVVCIGFSIPVVKLINQFFEQGYYATTFLGNDSTLFVNNKLKGKGVPFYYTSAVPDPVMSNISIAKNYLRDIAAYAPDETPNILSFTYYISAAIVVEALKKIEGLVTHKKLMREIESMRGYDLGGFLVNFDPANRHVYGDQVSIIQGYKRA